MVDTKNKRKCLRTHLNRFKQLIMEDFDIKKAKRLSTALFLVYVLLILLLLASCKSVKTVDKTVDIRQKEISYVLPSSNSLTVESLCDSIAGLPVQISQTIKSSIGEVSLKTDGNSLKVKIITDTVFKKMVDYKYLDKEVEKEVAVLPKWAKWSLGIMGFLVVLFIAIPDIPFFLRKLFL